MTGYNAEIIISANTPNAEIRRLRANWTMEAQQDLRAIHNLYAEDQLAQDIIFEINQEIDQEILNDLININDMPQLPDIMLDFSVFETVTLVGNNRVWHSPSVTARRYEKQERCNWLKEGF